MNEYKALLLSGGYQADELDEKHTKILNDYFEKGWEYVECISQSLSQGANSTEYGSVIVILKRYVDPNAGPEIEEHLIL